MSELFDAKKPSLVKLVEVLVASEVGWEENVPVQCHQIVVSICRLLLLATEAEARVQPER